MLLAQSTHNSTLRSGELGVHRPAPLEDLIIIKKKRGRCSALGESSWYRRTAWCDSSIFEVKFRIVKLGDDILALKWWIAEKVKRSSRTGECSGAPALIAFSEEKAVFTKEERLKVYRTLSVIYLPVSLCPERATFLETRKISHLLEAKWEPIVASERWNRRRQNKIGEQAKPTKKKTTRSNRGKTIMNYSIYNHFLYIQVSKTNEREG